MAAAPDSLTTVPPLESGDRMTRFEFERRYEASLPSVRAELIEGVVYVSSPVSLAHGDDHSDLAAWLGVYRALTPGVRTSDNSTIRLDLDNEPQPDLHLRYISSTRNRQEDRYLAGPPELVVEVAATSASIDLRDKFRAYQRNGVQEYIVWRVYDRVLDWFALEGGVYVPLTPDSAGVIHSRVFPGLRLAVQAFLEGDMETVIREQLGAR
jgi:Uma2 family endonuclease